MPLGIPFLYQRISSTTPLTIFIATKPTHTTFTVLRLDGTTDWIVAQRSALLAWTGHTLTASPRTQLGLSVAHWGNTLLTGRGLAALTAPGQTYQVTLAENEEFLAHPSHVVAYTVGKNMPVPTKMKERNSLSSLKLQIPTIAMRWFDNIAWTRKVKASKPYAYLAQVTFTLRTLARTWLWGDGMLLRFCGPTTLLLSSRGVRAAEVLTSSQVNEIADTEVGNVRNVIDKAIMGEKADKTISMAKVQETSKAGILDEGKELKEFVR